MKTVRAGKERRREEDWKERKKVEEKRDRKATIGSSSLLF